MDLCLYFLPLLGKKSLFCASRSCKKNYGGFSLLLGCFFVCLDLISVFLAFYMCVSGSSFPELEGLSFLVLRFLLLAARSLDLWSWHEGGKRQDAIYLASSCQLLALRFFFVNQVIFLDKVFPCKIELLFLHLILYLLRPLYSGWIFKLLSWIIT